MIKEIDKIVDLLNKIISKEIKNKYLKESTTLALESIIDILEYQIKFNEEMNKKFIKKELTNMVSVDEAIKLLKLL